MTIIERLLYPQRQKAFIMLKKILMGTALCAALASQAAWAKESAAITAYKSALCTGVAMIDSDNVAYVYDGIPDKKLDQLQAKNLQAYKKALNETMQLDNATLNKSITVAQQLVLSKSDLKSLANAMKQAGQSKADAAEIMKNSSFKSCVQTLNKVQF